MVSLDGLSLGFYFRTSCVSNRWSIWSGAIQSLRRSDDEKALLCCFGDSKRSSLLHLIWFSLAVFKFHPSWCDWTVLSSQLCAFFKYFIFPFYAFLRTCCFVQLPSNCIAAFLRGGSCSRTSLSLDGSWVLTLWFFWDFPKPLSIQISLFNK